MRPELISKIGEMENEVVPTLFKPVQFNIIKKLKMGKPLTENEKRYLRGKMKKKIEVIGKLALQKKEGDYVVFLKSLNSYYITGLEALKHNGYGWYFDTKIIEVINTKIEGKLRIEDKTLKLIRVKSIKKSTCKIDKKTGLKYATNEQIFEDIKITKNDYTSSVWKQMLSRYGKLFLDSYNEKYKKLLRKSLSVDYSKYGG